MGGEASEGSLLSASVFTVVVDVSDPGVESFVEILERVAAKAGQEVTAYPSEPAFYLAPALGYIGLGVDQGDAQRGADLLEVQSAES